MKTIPKSSGVQNWKKKLINVNMNSWSFVAPGWPWNGHLRLLPLLCCWSIWQPWILTRFIRISTVSVKPLPVLYGGLAFGVFLNRGGISSGGRVFDCRAGWGRRFDSRDQTNTQGLKITEKWRSFLCPAGGWTFAWLGWPCKMAVPSPLGDVKYSVPN